MLNRFGVSATHNLHIAGECNYNQVCSMPFVLTTCSHFETLVRGRDHNCVCKVFEIPQKYENRVYCIAITMSSLVSCNRRNGSGKMILGEKSVQYSRQARKTSPAATLHMAYENCIARNNNWFLTSFSVGKSMGTWQSCGSTRMLCIVAATCLNTENAEYSCFKLVWKYPSTYVRHLKVTWNSRRQHHGHGLRAIFKNISIFQGASKPTPKWTLAMTAHMS